MIVKKILLILLSLFKILFDSISSYRDCYVFICGVSIFGVDFFSNPKLIKER